ncbi:hypothetical protein HNP38_001145 [Chryseobacterium defluvii]|uniref:Uncharacterized protein n=1 Tax=Chryseobacterium defluvii TaxID=160396 RepID=A0A840KEA6_9FLAO|nr:hypothetical protein [Chryseobacterium defluvii]MBB4805873.1 hypothetical protein [Chryseobacterium defluvii]
MEGFSAIPNNMIQIQRIPQSSKSMADITKTTGQLNIGTSSI